MNCPECGLLTWHYDDQTLTCKRGHHTPTGAPETPPVAATRLSVPAWVWGLPGMAALLVKLAEVVT